MATNNSINLKAQGTAYYNGTGTFSGVDASTAGFVLTSNGTGVAPSFQVLPASGTFVKQVRSINTTSSTITAVLPPDGTIPQIGEGTQIFSLAITPANSSNILSFQCTVQCTADTGLSQVIAMFQDATSNALCGIVGTYVPDPQIGIGNMILTYSMTAGTTSATTFTIRTGPSSAGNVYINRGGPALGASPLGSAKIASTFTITEYTA